MPDIFTKEQRSRVMSRIRGKGTKPELEIFRHLRREGIHFQKHYRRAPGSPDAAVPSRKLALFVDGDFWHGWRFPVWRDKLPAAYWRGKIEANVRRDRRNFARLRRAGWKVMRIWEHDLAPRKRDATLRRAADFLRR